MSPYSDCKHRLEFYIKDHILQNLLENSFPWFIWTWALENWNFNFPYLPIFKVIHRIVCCIFRVISWLKKWWKISKQINKTQKKITWHLYLPLDLAVVLVHQIKLCSGYLWHCTYIKSYLFFLYINWVSGKITVILLYILATLFKLM